MGIGTGVAIYFLIWWMMLFVSLPFRMKTQADMGEIVEGTEAAAPADPQILKRMIWNSVVSLGVFFLFWFVFYALDVSLDDLPKVFPEFE